MYRLLRVIFICFGFTAYMFASEAAIDVLELQPLQPGFDGRRAKNRLKMPEVSTGREYYDSLIKKAIRRHWAFTITVNFSGENGAFDCNGCSVPLSAGIFGKSPVTIEDIYLFSKLSNENKVRITNCVARAPERGGVPLGSTGVIFGGYRDDLYTTLLAPVELAFNTDQSEINLLFSGMYRFDVGSSEKYSIGLGYSIPFKSKKHTLEITCIGGELFRRGFVPDGTQRETSLKQFFREYIDIPDFINSAILKPKNLKLIPEQRVSGIGDIAVFGLVEYQDAVSVEAGLQFIFPTASKGEGLTVWEPVLGSDGAFQFDTFFQLLFETSSPYLNPFFRFAIEFSKSYKSDTTRIPTLVVNDVEFRTMVKNVPDLSAPQTFQEYYVDRFAEFDTCIPLFADKTPCVEIKNGKKFLLGIGSYAYKVFHVDLRLGLFYDFYYKAKDSFSNKRINCECDETLVIDKCLMEECSDQKSHSFSANLTYKFRNMFELSAGGQFTFLGKNVPKTSTAYLSFVAVF